MGKARIVNQLNGLPDKSGTSQYLRFIAGWNMSLGFQKLKATFELDFPECTLLQGYLTKTLFKPHVNLVFFLHAIFISYMYIFRLTCNQQNYLLVILRYLCKSTWCPNGSTDWLKWIQLEGLSKYRFPRFSLGYQAPRI